jgi:hypothetical protein
MSRLSFAVPMVLLVAVLAGCATATPYQPLTKGYGYAEQKLETDRYRITFSGNSSTDHQTVQNYLLYRAAELTLERGRDYFVVVGSSTHGQAGRSPTVGVGLGGFRIGGSGGVGIGIGTRTGGDGAEVLAQPVDAQHRRVDCGSHVAIIGSGRGPAEASRAAVGRLRMRRVESRLRDSP